MNHRRCGICLAGALSALAVPLHATVPADPVALLAKAAVPSAKPWKALEARKASIGKIEVEVGDVFDLAKPEENTWIGRTADRLHASTKEIVIRRLLLFAEGEPVRERIIYETERLLRALPFVKTARIDPRTEPDGTVVAVVRVQDAWTTQVNAGYSQVGGQKSKNFGVDEKNFLGEGKSMAFDLSKDPVRSTWGLAYGDPQLLGSRWTLDMRTQYLSDGFARSIQLQRPFYALDTPWSAGAAVSANHNLLYVYDHGIPVYQAPFVQNAFSLSGGLALHEAENRVWRAGLLLQRQDTAYGTITQTAPAGSLFPPSLTDRRLRGPALTFATQEDAFHEFVNLQAVDYPEDYNLAWNGDLTLGTYSRAWGSTLAAPFFLLEGSKGWSSSADDLTLLTASWGGRKPATGLEDSLMSFSLVKYQKLEEDRILAGLVAVDRAQRPDPEHWYYLGGDQGMRGFPNELHPGDARWLASLEYRLLTDQRWWGLVRLGYSAFVDLGSIHQMDGQGWSRTYSDVGFGLRLGNLRSSLGRVILLSVAVPLNRESYQNRWQFTFGNAMRF
ncbi:MAG: BamA/TamA family outer membrane protein [Geothrix sp.]|nr:BamA/TamA family outer membrane protein [Geothrix sp.]